MLCILSEDTCKEGTSRCLGEMELNDNVSKRLIKRVTEEFRERDRNLPVSGEGKRKGSCMEWMELHMEVEENIKPSLVAQADIFATFSQSNIFN